MGFEEIGAMSDGQTKILFSIFAFGRISQQIDLCEEETTSIEDIIEKEDFIPFNEW